MRTDLRKRLHTLEDQASGGARVICVHWYADEPEEAAQERLARWQSGESVDGVLAHPCEGESLVVYVRHFGALDSPNATGWKNFRSPRIEVC